MSTRPVTGKTRNLKAGKERGIVVQDPTTLGELAMSRNDTPRDTGPVEHVPADAPSAVIQQPLVDQNLLRESQAISLS